MGEHRAQPLDELGVVHAGERRHAENVASDREAQQLRTHESGAFGSVIGGDRGERRGHLVDENLEQRICGNAIRRGRAQ